MNTLLCVVLVLLCLSQLVVGKLADVELPCERHTKTVNTKAGPVQGCQHGHKDGDVAVFGNIPFAQDVSGEMRWTAPVPPKPWTKVKKCHSVLSECVQALDSGSEDCLNLDVYVPADALEQGTDAGLPVMVWIYGGGLAVGSKFENGMYDGRNVVRKHGHILVSVNYRLGALGWLNMKALADETDDGVLGNYGLMDQRLGMQWVQDNIAAFGGDPARVTIFGESAGAFSVCSHLTSEASHGLFQYAILESGNCDSDVFYFSKADALRFGEAKVNATKCDINSANVLDCMRKAPLKLLMDDEKMYPKYSSDGPIGFPIFTWGFTVDGTARGLRDTPNAMFAAGNYNPALKGIIAGTNKNEGSLFVPMVSQLIPDAVPLTKKGFDALMLRFFSSNANLASIEAMYPVSSYNNSYSRVVGTIIRDWFFVCSTRRLMRHAYDHNVTSNEYHFTYKGDWIDTDILGDYHSSELPFVFDNPWPPVVHHFTKKDKQVAAMFGAWWHNFAATGDPNPDANNDIDWPAFIEGQQEQDVLVTVPPALEQNLYAKECDMWDTITPQ